MKIAIDIDGVIADYNWPIIVGEAFGVKLSHNQISQYSTEDLLGVTHEEVRSMFQRAAVKDCSTIIPGVRGAMDIISRDHKIYICTNRLLFTSIDKVKEWLNRNRIPYNHICTIKEMKTERFDFAVDDSPAKLAGINSKIRLLFDQPYNRDCKDVKHQFIRVYDWKGVLWYLGYTIKS